MPVHHPVQNHAQRVDVRLRAVVPAVGDLGSHVARGADQSSGGGLLGHLGNAEIAQLEFAPVGDQNILRLDVPVDNMVLLTGEQRAAEAQPQLQDGRLMVVNAQNLLQGLQKLHADVNIPADAVRVLHALHLVAGDHVPAAVQLLRQGVLVDEPLHLVFVMGGNILLAERLGI